MNNYISSIKNISSVSLTLKNGIEYIKKNICVDTYDEDIEKLIEDSESALNTIDKVLTPLYSKIHSGSNLKNYTKRLKTIFKKMKEEFYCGNIDKCIILNKESSDEYTKWKKAFDNTLGKYTIS
ncbi:hypothetical protein [Clostridium rectalis]|uniref:hypothetical protein n=1 Tax=Clostridium rectalis TaxID=2040295 RepID=UPI000F63431A|nr:hypothetical protein [Clostridium rectalis]